MENQNNNNQDQQRKRVAEPAEHSEQQKDFPKIIVPLPARQFEVRHFPFIMRGKEYTWNPKPALKKVVPRDQPDQYLLSSVQANIKLLNTDELNRVFNLIDKIAENRKNDVALNFSNYEEVCQEIKYMKEKRSAAKKHEKQMEKARFNPPVINIDKPAPRSNKLDPRQKVLMEMDKEDTFDALVRVFNERAKRADAEAIVMNRPEYRYTCDFGDMGVKNVMSHMDHEIEKAIASEPKIKK